MSPENHELKENPCAREGEGSGLSLSQTGHPGCLISIHQAGAIGAFERIKAAGLDDGLLHIDPVGDGKLRDKLFEATRGGAS